MSTLPSIDGDMSLPELPSINARFFVPRFVEKPQDPIMDTLKLDASKSSTGDHFRLDLLPKELSIIYEQNVSAKTMDSVWSDAIKPNVLGRTSQIHSWDTLRSSVPKPAASSGFLSEQDAIVFAAAHYQALPILHDMHSIVQYVSLRDLLRNMKLTALGFNSLLHEWDSGEERFVDIGLKKGMRKRFIIEGKDEAISAGVISRFIKLGTSLRRLETLVADLRSRSGKGPTLYAFAHAISTCLGHIRKSLSSGPPSDEQLSTNHLALTSMFMYYEQHGDILTALSVLCKRHGEDLSPKAYESIPASPQALLSHIYDHLHDHIERQSSHLVIAIFAFILTRSSTEYFLEVSQSIGFGRSDGQVHENEAPKECPTFFPPQLTSALPIAQKSLKLLQAAQPNHPLLQNSKRSLDIRWFWTTNEILAAVDSSETPKDVNVVEKAEDQLSSSSTVYLPELVEFRVYDLEPGYLIGQSCFDTTYTSAPTLALDNFIKTFPPSLPPISPTLSHLTSLVVKPLLQHATTLSNTLLSLFLALPPPLNIHSHLHLMRSYMLLMSPSFRTQLSAALFSDSGDFDADVKSSGVLSLRHRSQNADLQSKTWAVGIAPALLDRATWPPMDTDLSFFLRTVILDSFEANANDDALRSRVEEIENRLGFAVRDLPTSAGQNAWMNPLHIEALDFLYMDYKPPQPLDVIITPDILSKYQRVFSFLLRISRVQHAIHAVFRMSNSSSPFVFGTLASSRKMLLHFRFIAQSFVTNLVEYVYDTAIAGNIDPFLEKLRQPEDFTGTKGHQAEYSDVFSLAEAHANVMNHILTACLLRTGQKISGGALREALKVVLEFSVLIGDLYRGRLEEYQAASVLESLYVQFQQKMANLIKVLSSTVDQNVALRALLEVPQSTGPHDQRIPTGGIEALSHLLIRLDFGEWWLTGDKTSDERRL